MSIIYALVPSLAIEPGHRWRYFAPSMKRYDKYPPGTVEDARNLPPMVKVMGLHPLVWGLIFVFVMAGIGLYAETVGFYEIDHIIEGEDDHGDDDHENDNNDDNNNDNGTSKDDATDD